MASRAVANVRNPKFEILHYNKPVIRFFLQSDVVDYIVLDLPKAR